MCTHETLYNQQSPGNIHQVSRALPTAGNSTIPYMAIVIQAGSYCTIDITNAERS